jgi:hypothetical protein
MVESLKSEKQPVLEKYRKLILHVLNHFRLFRESLNSTNNFGTFLRLENEQPRLSILNNFKSINRVMRSTFLKDPKEL